MKNRILSVILALALLASSAILLVGCGGSECEHAQYDENGKCTECGEVVITPTAHTVNLVDYQGAPVDVTAIVHLFKGTKEIASARPNDLGVATFNCIPSNYTLTIDFLDASYYFDTAEATFTTDKNSVTLTLFELPGDETQTISVPCSNHVDSDGNGSCDSCFAFIIIDPIGNERYAAKKVGEGATIVEIDRAYMSYFIFTPTRGGVYKVSFELDGEARCGYFGSPHYVQPNSPAEVVNNSFEVTVADSSVSSGEGGTVQLVLGVGSDTATTAVMKIERIRDNEKTIPFTEILPSGNIAEYVPTEGATYVDFDVTSKTAKAVYNEADGFYHYGSADGPVILLKISADKKVYEYEPNSRPNVYPVNSHLDNMSFSTFNQILLNGNICCFFYDEDGETVVRKELYNALIEAYVEKSGAYKAPCIKYDDAGNSQTTTADVYLIPLDAALASAIQNSGEHNGWWDLSSGSSSPVFGEHAADVNKDLAWLFMCCYEA